MTPQRHQRIRQMLATRQPSLTVCLEQVHKPHNVSAIIRTADAVGVHDVHAIWPYTKMKTLVSAAAGSNSWVQVKTHPDINSAVEQLKGEGMQILATNLSDKAVDFRQIDYTKPTCILLGQEKTGISDEALALADEHIIIPMIGMVQSLNVSVAAAVILYEAQRQREMAGMYQQRSQLDDEAQQRHLFEGGYPVLARVAKQKGLPYPYIDENGEIVASDTWWQMIQSTKIHRPYQPKAED